jgi:N-formylglutamate amidohydrolase
MMSHQQNGHPPNPVSSPISLTPASDPGSLSDAVAVDVRAPVAQTIPFVFSSPHSGTDYPADFLEQSRLDALSIRRSEDSFVDELFGAAPELGAPLLRALFPRAYLDPNREAYELDPGMFADALPAHVNTRSLRVAGGLGTIARVVSDGAEIYRGKLPWAEAERRIAACYHPYHQRLEGLLTKTRQQFGMAILVDCHSMPSIGGPQDLDTGHGRPDIVLGDRFGNACSLRVVETATRILTGLGYVVARNDPYAGGYITHHWGRPGQGFHALQIELKRDLYMDEDAITRGPRFEAVQADMTEFMRRMAAGDWSALARRF